MQSQVRFNRVPAKVPEKFLREGPREGCGNLNKHYVLIKIAEKFSTGSLGFAGSGEGCREGPREGFGNLWCRARSVSNRFNRVSSAWLCGTLQKDL